MPPRSGKKQPPSTPVHRGRNKPQVPPLRFAPVGACDSNGFFRVLDTLKSIVFIADFFEKTNKVTDSRDDILWRGQVFLAETLAGTTEFVIPTGAKRSGGTCGFLADTHPNP